MSYGIIAQPVGPGPATPAPLSIDSGSTFPQYIGDYGVTMEYRDNSAGFSVGGFDGRGSLVLIPSSPLGVVKYVGTSGVPSMLGVKGVGVSGNYVSLSLQSASYRNLYWSVSFRAYKIWPRADQSYGISFANTVDYFSLNDGGVVGQCVWAYQGAVGDGFTIPTIPGFDPNRYSVFMYWNQGNAVAFYNPANRQIRVTYNFANNNGGNTIGNAKILVFCDGAHIVEHNGGLNIYSPDGSKCVFSTYRSPFMFKSMLSTGGGNPGLAEPAICLTQTGLAFANSGGNHGWIYQHLRGSTNVNGSIGTGFGPHVSTWTNNYPVGISTVTSLALPVIDAKDYIA